MDREQYRSMGLRWLNISRDIESEYEISLAQEDWTAAVHHAREATWLLSIAAVMTTAEPGKSTDDYLTIRQDFQLTERNIGLASLFEEGVTTVDPFLAVGNGREYTQGDATVAGTKLRSAIEIVEQVLGHSLAPPSPWVRIPTNKYPVVGRCIYCRSDSYSPNSAQRLGDEHIIPEGLGGHLLLQQASCQDCERRTSKFELYCLKKIFGPLRIHYRLPSKKGGKDRPTTVPAEIKRRVDGPCEPIHIPAAIYPVAVALFPCSPPQILGPTDDLGERQIIVRSVTSFEDANARLELIKWLHRAHTVYLDWHVDMLPFRKMIAKIAHSYLVMELGQDGFKPLLPDLIRGTDQAADGLLGRELVGTAGPLRPSLSETGHLLDREIVTTNGHSYHVVRVGLFRQHALPEYLAVAGEVIA
jgi:hypothetical protein